MPVDIKELVLRAVAKPAEGEGGRHDGSPTISEEEIDSWRQDLIGACVREVMTILRRDKER